LTFRQKTIRLQLCGILKRSRAHFSVQPRKLCWQRLRQLDLSAGQHSCRRTGGDHGLGAGDQPDLPARHGADEHGSRIHEHT
ncbi:MAG: hypothetical protein ACK47M_09870, partial [Caldilinea sp.]